MDQPGGVLGPLPGMFGDLGRNALRGPGISQLDLTLSKQFRVTEKTNLSNFARRFNF